MHSSHSENTRWRALLLLRRCSACRRKPIDLKATHPRKIERSSPELRWRGWPFFDKCEASTGYEMPALAGSDRRAFRMTRSATQRAKDLEPSPTSDHFSVK